MTHVSTYRHRSRPSGPTEVGLHGGLVTLTYLGYHGVISEFYDAFSATKRFRRRLNTRWVIPGVLTSLAMMLLAPLAMAVKPEESGEFLGLCLIGLMACSIFATLTSLFFLRPTVILKFYDDNKTYRVEFDYIPGQDPLLDTIVDAATEHDSPTGPLRISNTISHTRDWLCTFIFRYIFFTTFLLYNLLKYVVFALLAVVVVIMVVFIFLFEEPTETPEEPPAPETPAATDSSPPSPLFMFLFATPAIGVVFYSVGQIRKAKGPWSHRRARRQILRLARKRDMTGVKDKLERMLATDPGDYESAFLLAQLRMAEGDYDGAHRSLEACTQLPDAEWSTWKLHLDYIEMLDGRNASPDVEKSRNWKQELAGST